MRTTLIAIISYLFGDVVNPVYLFIGLYALSFVGLYFFWKWKKFTPFEGENLRESRHF